MHVRSPSVVFNESEQVYAYNAICWCKLFEQHMVYMHTPTVC